MCRNVQKVPAQPREGGYSEQNPEDWVQQTIEALAELVSISNVQAKDIDGISYSGQMHGLVLLDQDRQVLRNAILWNDTRTTPQCIRMTEKFGDHLLDITKNRVLEGFTLPKMLWVKEHEPELFKKTAVFLLPKDYVRFRMTGAIHTEYSDAAGTLLLHITRKEWSNDICNQIGISADICPPLVESHDCVGSLLPHVAAKTGLLEKTKVYAGGADNACGAIGAGILSSGKTLCSIGTSGSYFPTKKKKKETLKGKSTFLIMEKRILFIRWASRSLQDTAWTGLKERLHQTNRLSNYCRGWKLFR